jgi:hypothetical protein
MIFQRKTLSDDEYIDLLRKRHRAFRRMGWISLGLFVAMIGVLLQFVSTIQKYSASLPEDESGYRAGLVLGICFGFMFVIFTAQAGFTLKNWIESRNGFRAERLLIQYYDRLKGLESEGNPEIEKIL